MNAARPHAVLRTDFRAQLGGNDETIHQFLRSNILPNPWRLIAPQHVRKQSSSPSGRSDMSNDRLACARIYVLAFNDRTSRLSSKKRGDCRGRQFCAALAWFKEPDHLRR